MLAEPSQRKVYVVMVADLFHYGHVEFLKHARAFGNYLIVGLLTDERVKQYKRLPIMNLEERMWVIESCRYVDEVVIHQSQRSVEWFKAQGIVARVHAVGTETDRARKANRLNRPGLPPKFEIPYQKDISTTAIIRRIKSRNFN